MSEVMIDGINFDVVRIPVGYCIERLNLSLKDKPLYRLYYNGMRNRWRLPGMSCKVFKTLGHLRVVLKRLKSIYPYGYKFNVVPVYV